MKFLSTIISCLILTQNAQAFAPAKWSNQRLGQSKPAWNTRSSSSSNTQRQVYLDSSVFHDAHVQLDHLASILTSASPSLVLSDAADATTQVAKDDNGWFGFLEGPIEFLLKGIHATLVGMGMNEDAWGVTIIAMTTLIKLATYPLTKSQLESTNKMQALQPTIKELQAKYASNPEVMNQKIAAVYQTNEINPLAGCIPSLLQIPIFIGLYRAVLTLAKEDKLDEPFLWLPNLEGPTYGADPSTASSWILSGWSNGAPSLGWEDTLAFLSIPIILVISQSFSMQMMASKDQEQPAFLKFLPLMIGWFSLNVPAALGIYWVANNFITTALTLQIRSTFKDTPIIQPGGSASAGVVDVKPVSFTPAPIREKPAGFGASTNSVSDMDDDDVQPITPMGDDAMETGFDSEESSSTQTKKKKKKKGKKQ